MKSTTAAIALVLALGLAGCQQAAVNDAAAPAAAAAVDTAGIRAAIIEMSAAYQNAERAGDAAAIMAFHADDAVLLPPGEPLARGREAVDAYLTANSSDQEDVTFTTLDVEISEAGDMAYEIGAITGPGFAGKYITVYRLTDAGWRIVADTWNGDAPAAAASNG